MTSLIAFVALAIQTSSNLVVNGSFTDSISEWQGSGAKQVLNEGATNFVRMVIKSKPAQPYDVMMSQPLNAQLPSGSEVTLEFEGRSSTGNRVSAMIEDAGQPYNKYIQSFFDLGPTWKSFAVKGKLSKDLEYGATQFTLHCGFSAGTLDIRNVKVICPNAKVTNETYPQTILKPMQGSPPVWIGEGKAKPSTKFGTVIGNGFSGATTVTVDSVGNNPWDCQVSTSPLEGGIQKNSIAYMKVWLRSSDKVSVSMVYEQKVAPNTKNIFETVMPDETWRQYMVAAPASISLSKDSGQVKLFFSGKGTVEIGNLTLESLGPKVDLTKIPQYLGPNPYVVDKKWRQTNDAQVAKLRSGLLTVLVTDAKGKPKKNALVRVQQQTQKFRFGTAIPIALLMQEDKDGDQIRQTIKRLCNTVTFGNDLKWNGGGPELFPDWIYPAYAWIQKNGIELRGHNLVWGSYQNLPAVDKTWSKEKTWDAVKTHVEDYATRMKGKPYVWDVVNEAVSETELWEKIGWDKFVEVFRIVRRIDPTVKLCYNDYNMNVTGHREAAIGRANSVRSAGAPIDIFGDQAHLSRPIVTPAQLNAIWDEINAKTGLPIEITEFDFSSFDDQLQADYVEDFYRAAYAHPKVEGIVMWGFWEKDHWKAAQGGHMIRADWSWRPAMKALDNLINQRWKTNITLRTNAKGEVKLPAFYGKYEIAAGGKSLKVNHLAAGTVARIR